MSEDQGGRGQAREKPGGIGRRTAIVGLGALLANGAPPVRAAEDSVRAAEDPVRAAENWGAVQEAARKDGRVTFYHNLRPQGAEILLGEFRKANPGIQTEHIRLGSAPLTERYATEFNAGRNLADVLLTFPDDAYFAGVDKGGWALEWTPPELAAFRPANNHNHRTFPVHTGRNVIIWNKQRVKPADVPTEWTDLWDPRWKGRVGMDPPWRSISVQSLVAFWTRNGNQDAARKLKANDVRFFEGSAGVYQAVLRGDVMVATLTDLPVEPGLEDGAPIGFVYPKSGTTFIEGYLLVNDRAPHKAAGQVLANWLLSAHGQEVLQEQDGLPVTRPGVPPPKFLPPTASLSNPVDGLALLRGPGADQEIETWRAVFGIR